MASADYKGIVDFAQAIDDTYVRKDAPSVPVGGAKGEVLRKKSGTDGDAEWANPLYHFSTLAEMQAALALGQIPDGANVSVEEEQPGGNTGDTSLDTTSENWVQNKVVATAVNTITSDLASYGDSDLLLTFYNSTEQAKAVSDLSQYRYILLVHTGSGDANFYFPAMLPMSVFKTGFPLWSGSPSSNSYSNITYVSDTSIKCVDLDGRYSRVYGIK